MRKVVKIGAIGATLVSITWAFPHVYEHSITVDKVKALREHVLAITPNDDEPKTPQYELNEYQKDRLRCNKILEHESYYERGIISTGMYKQIFGDVHVKILNMKDGLKHKQHQYHVGRNIDYKKFYPYNSCRAGGLYFTTPKRAKDFYQYGDTVVLIDLVPELPIYSEDGKAKTPAFDIDINKVYPLDVFAECNEKYSCDNEHLLKCLYYKSTSVSDIVRNKFKNLIANQ